MPQRGLVKSDEFENSSPYISLLNSDYVSACSSAIKPVRVKLLIAISRVYQLVRS